MSKTKKLVLLSLFVAGAIVLSIIESMFPVPVAVYGVKLGLANIITIVLLYFFGVKEAVIVVFVRVLLSSMYGGGFVVFLFSVTGGILSAVVMWILMKVLADRVSLVSISIVGSIVHNAGQLIVAGFVLNDFAVMAYLPVLMVSGVIMGVFTGFIGSFLIGSLKKTKLFIAVK